MMERECKRCGRMYRGLVCHACHPRTTRKREAGPGGAEVLADAQPEGAAPSQDGDAAGALSYPGTLTEEQAAALRAALAAQLDSARPVAVLTEECEVGYAGQIEA